LSADWARYSTGVCGANAHVIYDPDADHPVYVSVTPSRLNDPRLRGGRLSRRRGKCPSKRAPPAPAPAKAGVFDLGYYDYAWWARLDRAGRRIVTRFKRNTPLEVTAELDVPEGGDILSDRIGLLPARQARSRKNPFTDPVREVRVRTESGKILRILCNDLDAGADEIAALYKRRWAIELFPDRVGDRPSAGSSKP